MGGGWQVTNAFRQRVHWGLSRYEAEGAAEEVASPMPFGSESTGDHINQKNTNDKNQSPMPFGSESTGDQREGAQGAWGIHGVTNAFRQRVHWGPCSP